MSQDFIRQLDNECLGGVLAD